MAPRKPKQDDDAASTTSTEPSILKPKTEKAKVEKKAPKTPKPKAEKVPKTVSAKKVAAIEGAVGDGEGKVKKTTGVGAGARAGSGGGNGGNGVGGGGKEGKDGNGGKEKVKAVTGDEAVELMLGYLRGQNRPYSAGDVSLNLHGKVTKTVADKLLKEMEQNGLIMGKATKKDGGGQWVFWAIQDPADAATPEELALMDSTITTLRETLPTQKSTLKILTSKLTTLKSAPTSSDLLSTIEKMQKEKEEKGEKLKGFKEGSVKMVKREEMEEVEKEWKFWMGKRKARKRAFENLEAVLLDGMTREEIWERVGVEPDVM